MQSAVFLDNFDMAYLAFVIAGTIAAAFYVGRLSASARTPPPMIGSHWPWWIKKGMATSTVGGWDDQVDTFIAFSVPAEGAEEVYLPVKPRGLP